MKKTFSITAVLLGTFSLIAGLWGVLQRGAKGWSSLFTLRVDARALLGYGNTLTGLQSLNALLVRVWPVLAGVGAALLVLGLVLWGIARDQEADAPQIALSPDGANLKRRVRTLLQARWLTVLGALVLSTLPALLVTCGAVWYALPRIHLSFDPLDLLVWVFSPAYQGLVQFVPLAFALLMLLFFVLRPLHVSRAAYFLRMLRGRSPMAREVYGCFSARYPQTLAGMAYQTMWLLLWAALALVLPCVLQVLGIKLMDTFSETLSTYALYVGPALIVLCLLLGCAFLLVLANRALAYSMVPCILAAHPQLTPRRALQLSRCLMRGQKWAMLRLALSNVLWYLPSVFVAMCYAIVLLVHAIQPLAQVVRDVALIAFIAIALVNQLVLCYVAPLGYSSFYAFYLERKRMAILYGDVVPADFLPPGATPRPVQAQVRAQEEEEEAQPLGRRRARALARAQEKE